MLLYFTLLPLEEGTLNYFGLKRMLKTLLLTFKLPKPLTKFVSVKETSKEFQDSLFIKKLGIV